MGGCIGWVSDMRLSTHYREVIKNAAKEVFGEDAQIFLFGSRVDDAKLGGDIDLYIKTPDKTNLQRKKSKFIAALYKKIGEQKIDVVFDEDETRPIEQEAVKWGIAL